MLLPTLLMLLPIITAFLQYKKWSNKPISYPRNYTPILWLFLSFIHGVIKNAYGCSFVAKLSWKKKIFCRKKCFYMEKTFCNHKVFLLENFFLQRKIIISFQKYIFAQNICVINKIWIFLKYNYSFYKCFLIIKNIFVKTSLWTQ